jgi:hypothetical protein
MAASTPTTKTTGPTTISTDQWAAGLINQLNTTRPANKQIPVTANNVNNIKIWLGNEQNASSWKNNAYNPLGVRNGPNREVTPYASIQDGLAGTASTLNNGYYTNILATLQADAPTNAFASAVIQSPWSGKTYSQRGMAYWLQNGPLNATITTDKANAAGSTGNWYDGIPGSGVVANAVNAITGTASGVGNAVGGAVDTAGSVATLAGNLTSASFWKRIGIFTGGLALFGVGLTVFTLNTKTAQTAISTAAAIK